MICPVGFVPPPAQTEQYAHSTEELLRVARRLGCRPTMQPTNQPTNVCVAFLYALVYDMRNVCAPKLTICSLCVELYYVVIICFILCQRSRFHICRCNRNVLFGVIVFICCFVDSY